MNRLPHLCALLLGYLAAFSPAANSAELWKGMPARHEYTAGVLGGLGIYDGTPGFTLKAHGAIRLMERGFVPEDVNNQVFLEAQAGPLILTGGHVVLMNLHARWDFGYDEIWTFYGIGGVGVSVSSPTLGNSWRLFPHFGVGAVMAVSDFLDWRSEVCQDFIGTGVSLRF